MKRIIKFLLVCSTVLGVGGMGILVGCSALPDLTLPLRPTATPPPIPMSPTPSPTATPVTALTPTPGPVTLDLWVPDFLNPYDEGPVAAVLNEQLATFTATHSDIQVRVTMKKDTGPGGLYDLLSTAAGVAPAVVPDLIVLNQHDLRAAATEGLLQPMDDYLTADAGYFDPVLDAVRVSEAFWAFPYVARANQMAYREDITTTAPLSWTAVLTPGHRLLLPTTPTDGLGGDTLLAIYMGSGGRVLDTGGQATLERAHLERVYGFFWDLQQAGLLDADRVLALSTLSACWDSYQEGYADLIPVPIARFWLEPLEDALPSWAPTEDGAPITVVHTWGLAITTQEPVRRDAALTLARWLVAGQQMADLTRAAQLVPTHVQAVDRWSLLPEGSTFLKALLSAGVPALPPAVDAPVRRALQAGLTVLLQQDVDSPAAAASYALTVLRR